MSDSASGSWRLFSRSKETTPKKRKAVQWKIVARTLGLTPATIIAGRLHAEGIPVRAWQEGAGQALGLTVGILGTGNVSVPEEFVEQALAILAEDVEYNVDEMNWEDE